MSGINFASLNELAIHLRSELESKKFILLFAYNGTGKTRLSTEFKNLGKRMNDDGETISQDTLYFNAFTEDLFSWDNDLERDSRRVMRINADSRFFNGLEELEMESRIGRLLERYADFNFFIDYGSREIIFSRDQDGNGDPIAIKVSRGEENIFIWCFFLAVAQLAIDKQEAYNWVEYIYIDDPISSLDENNAIAVANHLIQLLVSAEDGPKTVVSTHHVLFFNVLCNELKKKAYRYLLSKGQGLDTYTLQNSSSKPFLHHLASLVDLNERQKTGDLYTYHFNVMRRAMEQAANFFGMDSWTDCINVEDDDPDKPLYKRVIDLMSHGDYSLYEARVMGEENKNYFRKIFRLFISRHPFNPSLFYSEEAIVVSREGTV
ncbi:AAA family ATPase [Pseudomonas sp. S2.OTC.A_B10]|uniref:AAA family ATPase n=1 Tax=Pseudomonas sp. S2.OTC.A_B10 TaxID=3237018 RepID=UPI003CF269DE